jgi:dihydroorotase (multifunctional complex type)
LIVDSVFTNAKAFIKGQIVDCNIAVEEGRIEKIGKETQMPKADRKIDLHNLLVLPGLIDEHVHLRDEGRSYKEDFASGTAAAAAGGFTTVFDMPNNDPVTMSTETFRNRIKIASWKILVNVGLYSEFPRNPAEIKEIVKSGAVGFKLFMGSQVGGLNVDDDQMILEAFKEVVPLGVPVAVHAEDRILLSTNEQKLKQAKKNNTSDFEKAHTEVVEQKAIERLLKLTERIDLRLHFCHISTEAGLNTIVKSKKLGKKVTCEVTANHLILSNDDLKRYGQMVIMTPPLRSKSHVDALWKGIHDSEVNTLGSDHAPHTQSEKAAGSVWDVKVGVPGLETTLPLMMTLVRKNKLTLSKVVELLVEKPAQIFGITGLGSLEQGKKADFTILDFNTQFRIDASKFKSKAKFSPYNGWDVNGKPMKTIVNGELVFDEGEILAKNGSGSIVRGGKM